MTEGGNTDELRSTKIIRETSKKCLQKTAVVLGRNKRGSGGGQTGNGRYSLYVVITEFPIKVTRKLKPQNKKTSRSQNGVEGGVTGGRDRESL